MQNTDQLFELLKELSMQKVNFVVCGGVACVLQGVERATYDLDIAVSYEEDNIRKIIDIAKKFDMVPRIPEPAENLLSEQIRTKWIHEKNAMVFTFVSSSGPLQMDIFLTYPIPYKKLKNDADNMDIEHNTISVSSIEDLILAKKIIEPLRKKDIIDIEELERLTKDE